MRLLLFPGTLRNGGTERQAAVLATGLAGRGHRVTVAALFPGGTYWDSLSAAPGVELAALHDRRSRWRGGVAAQLLAAPRRLADLVSAVRCDVVYSLLEIPCLVAWQAVGRRERVPLAWGVRNSDPAAGPLVALAARAAARLSRRVPLVIYNSEAGRTRQRAAGWRGRRELVVPNGIDTGRFRPDRARGADLRRTWAGPGAARLFGVVGRVEGCKDHAGLLRAFARSGVANDGGRLVVVGEGPPRLVARLQDQARELGIAAQVEWAGRHDDMPTVYNALDAVVSASTTEGFPNVLGEAMACGVPCLATDVGDTARILGGSGRLVPPRDEDALSAALAGMTAATDGPPLQPLRERVVEHFGLPRLLAATEGALTELLSGKTGPAEGN